MPCLEKEMQITTDSLKSTGNILTSELPILTLDLWKRQNKQSSKISPRNQRPDLLKANVNRCV